MFDNLIINKEKLPVTDEEREKLGVFQTKDFDCTLTNVYITDEGKLEIELFGYEIVPENERPYPGDTGFRGLIGSTRRVGERMETIPYHGYVNFYTLVNNEWFEFNAKFTDGKLVGIERIN